MKRFLSGLLYCLTGILVFLVALVGFSSLWAVTSFGDIDMDEILFHLQQPLQGAGNGVIGDYLLKGLFPAVLVLAVYIILILVLKKGKQRLICSGAYFLASVLSAFFVKDMLWNRLDLGNWIEGRNTVSTFVEENYADPAEVVLTYPEKPRNLIYIYLESMETTYGDKASGGDFEKNTIPELTEIALENESFSGDEEVLNGGLVLPGTGFTTGAIFAQSAGLPLKLSISGNFMDTQSSFFPNVTAIGDILEGQGYRQIFLMGSDAVFGGRKLFCQEHGNYEIRDLLYARENGWIEPVYEVWWGYEDEKLFSFAKETLTELSGEEQPFSLTLLTVDTHYEDGYVCRLCREDFPGDQYANVMACSSRQVQSFLSWIRQQDFYKNTTVVICGDHTTMDTDFCKNVDRNYLRRVYTAYINAAAEPEEKNRTRLYSTMDLFPTTLAALGIGIQGDRLALGTNLFSGKDTLLEEYGIDSVKRELSRRSLLLEQLEKIDQHATEELMERLRYAFRDSLEILNYNPERKTAELSLTNLYLINGIADESMNIDAQKIEVEYQEDGSDIINSTELKKDIKKAGTFSGTADLSGWSTGKGEFRVNLYTIDGNVYKNIDTLTVDLK